VGHPRGGGGFTATQEKRRLSVPHHWKGPLTVTPLVLADAVAAAPRSAAVPRPFVFGPTALTPAASDGFPQGGVLHCAFRIFNWRAEEGKKPDLTAEYRFYQQTGRGRIFFNKTKPQHLGADTLGESFDPRSGAVTAGLSVPLQGFPFGEFEMAVRVTDNATRQTGERQARFVVVP
jgi:hypothetical protein